MISASYVGPLLAQTHRDPHSLYSVLHGITISTVSHAFTAISPSSMNCYPPSTKLQTHRQYIADTVSIQSSNAANVYSDMHYITCYDTLSIYITAENPNVVNNNSNDINPRIIANGQEMTN